MSKHYAFVTLADGSSRQAEPAATEDTARKRGEALAEKHGVDPAEVAIYLAESRADARAQHDASQVVMTNADYIAEVEDGETMPAEESPSLGDDITPSDEEIAEAAATGEALAEKARSDSSAVAEAARRTGRASGKAAGFYIVGLVDGEMYSGTTAHPDAATAQSVSLPHSSMTDVVVISAKSRVMAENAYEALAGDLPESGVLVTARKASTGGGTRTRKSVTAPSGEGDTTATWEPIEAEDGRYFASKTGLLHSQASCRFVRPTSLPLTDDTKTAVYRTLAARVDAEVTLPITDDGKVTVRFVCEACSGKRKVVVAPSADDSAATDAEEAEQVAETVEALEQHANTSAVADLLP